MLNLHVGRCVSVPCAHAAAAPVKFLNRRDVVRCRMPPAKVGGPSPTRIHATAQEGEAVQSWSLDEMVRTGITIPEIKWALKQGLLSREDKAKVTGDSRFSVSIAGEQLVEIKAQAKQALLAASASEAEATAKKGESQAAAGSSKAEATTTADEAKPKSQEVQDTKGEKEEQPFELRKVTANKEQLISRQKERESRGLWETTKRKAIQLYDNTFYEGALPPIGAARLSYSCFLRLLSQRMIKRLNILGDGKVAMVEIPIEQGGHDYDTQLYHDKDLAQLFVRELPEWKQEMLRFYVELPGDWWQQSDLYRHVHSFLPHKTADGHQHRSWITQDTQYVLEVRVRDPSANFGWVSEHAGSVTAIACLFGLRAALTVAEWIALKAGKITVRMTEKEKFAQEMGKSIAKAYNVGKDGKSTGVKFDDVAGIDNVKSSIQDILKMLLGATEYKEMGARVPRGILLEGPPGTGKTYLAKAMADEAGIPFFSANGSEFVQMFSGVAASRVRSLFKEARAVAPSIVFIDEVDAIGKARSAGATDGGSSEREQGLLQLLVEMDGFSIDDQVLVVAATNRKDVLDKALLRPGRFDRSIYMGLPTQGNRYKVLNVHARGKQISRENDDAILRQMAENTPGFSGAALANLMNEAAILQVRFAKSEIDMEVIDKALLKMRVGLPNPSLPLTKAKRHLASTFVGRGIGMALTAGMPPVEAISIKPYGKSQGRLVHPPQSMIGSGRDLTVLAYNPIRGEGLAEKGSFSFCADLMVPLYMGRATEEVLYGRDSATLSTSHNVAVAGDMAHWLVMNSRTNPAYFGSNIPTHSFDPLTTYQSPVQAERFTVRLQTVAYHRALTIVHERKTLIKTLTQEILDDPMEEITGERLLAGLDEELDSVDQSVLDNLPFAHIIPEEAEANFMLEEKNVLRAANFIKGDMDPGLTMSKEQIRQEARLLQQERDEWFERRRDMDRYATDEKSPFPSKPELTDTVIVV